MGWLSDYKVWVVRLNVSSWWGEYLNIHALKKNHKVKTQLLKSQVNDYRYSQCEWPGFHVGNRPTHIRTLENKAHDNFSTTGHDTTQHDTNIIKCATFPNKTKEINPTEHTPVSISCLVFWYTTEVGSSRSEVKGRSVTRISTSKSGPAKQKRKKKWLAELCLLYFLNLEKKSTVLKFPLLPKAKPFFFSSVILHYFL